MDKYLTFLYLRRGNSGVKTIRIHRGFAVFTIVFLLALTVLFVSSGIKYADTARRNSEIADLRSRNLRLKGKLNQYSIRVTALEKRMDKNFEVQNRVRMLAGMDPLSKDVWEAGVGGPNYRGMNRRGNGDGFLSDSSREKLAKLVRKSKLELENYKKITAILNKEKKVRDCTPSIRPLKGGFVSSGFGSRMDPFSGRLCTHEGVDFCARNGTPVKATGDGVVTMAEKNGGFGLVVEINHRIGFETKYAHLSKLLVERGQLVKRGEVIGLVGNTGRSTSSHLHYEVVFRGTNRNPLNYIIPEDSYFE
ncbi:MAG: M23 family metallopeptidase [Candidatus Krumholzibacteriota bacterium]|nr:M23 family metallopeptidase [Candidatus Krumholzibacteriota bacterium]